MTASLTTFAGSNYTVPLIPAAHEPAFCTASTSTNLFMWNQNFQLMAQYSIASGEFYDSGAWMANYSGTPSSNSGWQYSGTTLAGPHGHFYISINPAFNTSMRSTMYYTQGYQTSSNYYYGAVNSRSTGIWANKTIRDSLCIQRINNVGTYMYRTQISTLGYGALMNPMTYTGTMTGQVPGTANGYNTNASMGLVGYNEKTRMWVNGQNVSGTTCEMFVYKNISPPTMQEGLDSTYWDQFDHSAKITVSVTLPSSSSYDAQSWKIIPLDNGNIAVICKAENSYIQYKLYVGNNGVDSTSWTLSTSNNLSTTTSYNNDLWYDPLVAVTTYDGRYTYVYTQYYYYNTGMVGFIIRHSDGQWRGIEQANTTYAYSAVPIGANTLVMSYGTNTDGSGQYLMSYNLDYIFSRYTTDGTAVVGYRTNTYLDAPSSSTCYSMIFAVPSHIPRFIKGVV